MATSHKRETARRKPALTLLAGSVAAVATGAAVVVGVATADQSESHDLVAVDKNAPSAYIAPVERDPGLSRNAVRAVAEPPSPLERLLAPKAVAQAIKGAKAQKWTTASLNLWTRPDKSAKQVGEIDEGEKVRVTGRRFADRAELVLDGESRWVTAGYFSDEKPPTLGGACTNGTSVSSGVSPNIVKVHDAVCANFPEISVYGTLRGGGGDHPRGKAVDIMVSGSRGMQVADFVRANASALGVSYVIYSQRIWSVERSGEGWRSMPNRGSATANHYDHVHVSTY
ncbi:MAG: SH3 domain-containing protein [Nocardioidaceae bacterium]|nr:SH3 domain-containing protein [Nocardioidaceae bacterium]